LSAAQATFEWALELDPTESLARRRYERIQEMESGAAGDETSSEAETELAEAEPITQGEPIIEAEPIAEAEVAPVGEQDSDDEAVVAGEPLIEMELLNSDDEAEVVEIDRVEPGSGAEESPIPEMLIESAGDLTGDLRGGAALDGVSGLAGSRGNGHGDEKKTAEPPPNPATDDQLAWVIGRFQRDVSSQLGAGDHASHYDLGMAYMEMELYHEAISEFRQALGGATYRRRCLELLATCYSRAGEPQQAASHWRAALDEALKTGEGPLALRYELAVSLAAAGQVETAREELREVVRRDPKFLDANERLQALVA
jgi:TolA-binding protein